MGRECVVNVRFLLMNDIDILGGRYGERRRERGLGRRRKCKKETSILRIHILLEEHDCNILIWGRGIVGIGSGSGSGGGPRRGGKYWHGADCGGGGGGRVGRLLDGDGFGIFFLLFKRYEKMDFF